MVAIMFNNKGSTLIESLFAFQIYIIVIILFVSLLMQLFQGEIRISKHYQDIQKKEVNISYKNNYTEIIEEVLP